MYTRKVAISAGGSMQPEKEKLKEKLEALAETLLLCVKETLLYLKEFQKSGRRETEQKRLACYMPTAKEILNGDLTRLELARHDTLPYLVEIYSKLDSQSFFSILKDIDSYCLAIGVPPVRFFHQAIDYSHDPLKGQKVLVPLDTPQMIVNMVDKEYGESRCNDLETEKIFREEIYSQLTRLIKTPPQAGQGEKEITIKTAQKATETQADEWLNANKDRLREAPVQTQGKKKGKAKEFFKKHWQWLIAAIIVPIIAPIIVWIVIKRLGV